MVVVGAGQFPDSARFEAAVASWVTRGLALDGFEVVPWDAIVAARAPGQTPDSLAAALDAAIVVRITDRQQGDTRGLSAAIGTDTVGVQVYPVEPMHAAERLRREVAGAIAARLGLPAADTTLRSPPVFDRFIDYMDGVAAYLAQDYGGAANRLGRAGAAGFAPALLWEGLAHHALGDPIRVDSLAVLALDRVDLLTEAERHGARYLLARARGDLAQAQQAAGQAAVLEPSSIWTYHEAVAALGRNRLDEAASMLERVDPQSGPLRNWAPYWQVLAETMHLRGRHEEELDVARRARGIFPTRLDMLALEVRALAGLGRAEDVHLRLDRALALEGSSPDATAPITLMVTAGRELRAHGSPEGSERAFARALEWLGGRPDEERLSLGGVEFAGRVMYMTGMYDDAMGVYRSLAPTQLLVGWAEVQRSGETMRFASGRPPAARDPFTLTLLSYRGAAAARAGEQGEQVTVNRVERLLANLDDPHYRRLILHARARVAAASGDADGAIGLLRESIAAGLFPADLHADPDFDGLAEHRSYRALVRERD